MKQRYYQPATEVDPTPLVADLCVYAATAAGVMAAIQARRSGLSVALLNPGQHVGGMTSGGLSFTDVGNKFVIGGLARELYRRIGAHYGKPEEWCFEPSVATTVLHEMMKEAGVKALHGQYVAEATMGVDPAGQPRIQEIATTSGLRVRASYFLDCSYEGDLMARAGVGFRVGREAMEEFGEIHNGQQCRSTHNFERAVDPYQRPGDPSSGLLPGIDPDPTYFPGSADARIQAYNFRVCMTRRKDLRIPFPKPDGYDRGEHELLARYFAVGGRYELNKFDRIQGDKTDTNNHGPISTDFIGMNHRWPEGDYAEREAIFQAHLNYQQGHHWFLANDPAVPEEIRLRYSEWGLPSDEFTGTGHWPHQLYVREGRRLEGMAMLNQNHCLGLLDVEESVGMGAYMLDSHNCRRMVHNGYVLNEGDVQVMLPRPYPISLSTLRPKVGECANLMVPVCVSASHIAFGSLRMEPVFMILAQSAALAAVLAFESGYQAVQEISYQHLKPWLEKAGQILECDANIPTGSKAMHVSLEETIP
ncbi:MAG: FAD-dependent oxidoreductase [Terrimicrobiaceae bacterium]